MLQDFYSVSDHFGTLCIKGLTLQLNYTDQYYITDYGNILTEESLNKLSKTDLVAISINLQNENYEK